MAVSITIHSDTSNFGIVNTSNHISKHTLKQTGEFYRAGVYYSYISHDNKKLFCYLHTGTLKIYEISTGNVLRIINIREKLLGYREDEEYDPSLGDEIVISPNDEYCIIVYYSDEGQYEDDEDAIILSHVYNSISIWNINTGEFIGSHRFAYSVSGDILFSRDSQQCMVHSDGMDMIIYSMIDLQNGLVLSRRTVLDPDDDVDYDEIDITADCYGIGILPDSETFISSNAKHVCVRNIADGSVVRELFTTSREGDRIESRASYNGLYYVGNEVLTSDGQYCLVPTHSTIRIYRVSDGVCVNTINFLLHLGFIYQVSPDGKYILSRENRFNSTAETNLIKFASVPQPERLMDTCLWRISDGALICRMTYDFNIELPRRHYGRSYRLYSVFNIIFTSDSKYCVSITGRPRQYCTFWSVKTGKFVYAIEIPNHNPTELIPIRDNSETRIVAKNNRYCLINNSQNKTVIYEFPSFDRIRVRNWAVSLKKINPYKKAHAASSSLLSSYSYSISDLIAAVSSSSLNS